ncbi:molybdenum ABC transporter ATP-binding protein [Candidatus Nitronereus thalassa]|uniref:Molybdenum ABC transporter ATP-binding protein n=1 Tax=Candidatus Nitronereus thalassa TaxID=3020898 RepID=A0ABU3K537_9BACT|nr:molybdenum ABC transporter ATP-binding protein [Candidatus Nitronereus thalassa]MDT7041468.1 molybdenum ABC transporter ATP-binding protein [Candidatus Nitronereus thalassa]
MNQLDAKFQIEYPGFHLNVECIMPLDGTVAIFGASGSGKTTLLRCIAGLTRAPKGYLKFGKNIWQDEKNFLPIQKRRVGLVFQDARLFPHLNAKQNLEYGMKRTQPSKRQIHVDQVVDLLGLDKLLDRRTQHLSGGEQQRVAIGRALLTSPQLLLMDEPLASLDQERKKEILPFIQRLNQDLQIPVLYVSHDLNEMLQLANHMVLIKNGKVAATGTIQEVFARLDLPGLVEPNMVGAILETRVAEHEPEFGLTRVEFFGRSLFIPKQEMAVGSLLRVQIHARDVSVVVGAPAASSSVLNSLEATVIEIEESPIDQYAMEVKLDVGCPLLAMITRKSFHELNLHAGQKVHAHFKAVALS